MAAKDDADADAGADADAEADVDTNAGTVADAGAGHQSRAATGPPTCSKMLRAPVKPVADGPSNAFSRRA